MENMQLLSFDNLSQRVLHRYAFTFSDFILINSDAISEEAQRALYELFGSIVLGVATDPSILGLSTERPDEWLNENEVLNMRPELYKVRNECQKAFNDLSGFLYTLGICGELRNERLIVNQSDLPKLTAKTLKVYQNCFERFGLHIEKTEDSLILEFPKCPEALSVWQLLAAKCRGYSKNRQAIRFMLWLHHDDCKYFLQRIETLLGLDEGLFDYIAMKYQAKGYDVQFYINEYSTNLEYSKNVGGLLIAYATLSSTVRFVNTSSIGIKAMLEQADELETGIKYQIIRFCKPCNDCMVCTKGGKNRQFTVTVRYDADVYRLCPEFVQMEWYNSDISREKIDFMLELNELQERFGKNWRKTK